MLPRKSVLVDRGETVGITNGSAVRKPYLDGVAL